MNNLTTVRRVALAILIVMSIGSSVSLQSATLPIFPGAEGYGTSTRAAYGGPVAPTVYRVTNLNDSGAGSLRAAAETATGPRVVIFEVSGTITLATRLAIANPYITIAGQTAPSPGITLRNNWISVRTHDVLIQHLRVRTGDAPEGGDPESRDCLEVIGGAYNVVIDHNSFSWGIDENTSTWNDGGAQPHDVTWSNNITSEALRLSLHPKGHHSMGMLLGYGSKRIAVLRNLYANNEDRNPQIQRNSAVAVVNNVMYNTGVDWDRSTYLHDYDPSPALPTYAAIVGNSYIKGPNTPTTSTAIWTAAGMITGTQLYKADNRVEGVKEYLNTASFNPLVTSSPAAVPLTGLTILPSSQVEAHVRANAGARPADRDAVDVRIMSEVAQRTGRIVDSPSQVGGWPALAVNQRALTPPADPHSVSSSGYTNLEVWLQTYAAAVEGTTLTTLMAPATPTDVRVTP